MLMKFEEEKSNSYQSYLMNETEAFYSTLKERSDGKELNKFSDEMINIMHKSESAALEQLESKGITTEDIEKTWAGLAERIKNISDLGLK